jgi:LPXTG-motif cell wall-anchored protein
VYGGDEADANESDNKFSFQARVLGGIGTTDGKLYDGAGGDPETAPGVAGATILLTNTLDATVKASGTTGADGRYHIADVPAGQYKLEIVPPAGWASKDELGQIPALAQNSPPALIAMKRVVVPTMTAPAEPTPRPTVVPALPTTGTPVIWIGLTGAAALIVGVGLLVLARRRRSTV